MKKCSTHLKFCILSLIAGGILPFAFAPYSWFWLAPLALAAAGISWFEATPKQEFWRGLLFGIGFFSVGVWWIYVSIHV